MNRLSCLAFLVILAGFAWVAPNGLLAAPEPQGAKPIKPASADGRVLNFDFEDGTLKDWTATGDAFDGQPIKGDTVFARRSDMHSNHQGQYWVGGYEIRGDEATGTLTSIPFKVTHRWASFLVGGGHWDETRVELATAADKAVFFKVSGTDAEELRPVVVDLEKQLGKEIFIRLVDQRKDGWGHINFDDFEFYDQQPRFKDAVDPAASVELLQPDKVKFAGLPPEQAPKEMAMPEGFKAHLFAGEPDIVQPIAFAIDPRGRIWVAEGLTYPIRAPEGKGKDRILVFEDADGSGHFTKRSVFAEGLNLVSGLEVGFGGVWVGAAPYLYFIPADTNADDPKPSGPPQVLLDGFGYGDTHETLNTFTWGPDGWLYGCHGVFTQSDVGKPGTPKKDRVHINAGVWRYHPTKHIFERFAEGTSNPWGLDFDEHGQAIIEACVIPHLWHMIQNARYQRQGGNHDDPYTFDDIKTIADHLHYLGNKGPHAGNGKSDAAGGGHAHAGLMVYLGGSWPDEWRGKIFMNNIHGTRINMDILEPQGSGFVGHHGHDFILFNDSWSRIVNLRYDQDGSVYMIDWYDQQKCHTTDPKAVDRGNGRIFKVVYGDTKTTKVDLEKASDIELAKLQSDKHEWLARTARRMLQERAAVGKSIDPQAASSLADLLAKPGDTDLRLRALWACHAIGKLTEGRERELLSDSDPYIVAWAVQLLCEDSTVSSDDGKSLAELAAKSPSPVVRLYVASAALRIGVDQRAEIIAALLAHSEDAQDHNLPLMYWYGLESIADAEPQRMLTLALGTKVPHVLEYAVRRLSAGSDANLAILADSLEKADGDEQRVQVLQGMSSALKGRHDVPAPAAWDAVAGKLSESSDGQVRDLVRSLSVTFGSRAAIDAMRATLMDPRAAPGARESVLQSLVGIRDAGLAPKLQELLADENLRGPALRGLAVYDDRNTPKAVLDRYSSLTASEKKDALLTLASRASYARPLLAAVQAGAVPAGDASADVVRQLRNLHDPEVDKQVAKVWGTLRDSPAELKKRMAEIRAIVEAPGPAPDLSHGRVLFNKTCAQCHTLFGTGGKVGPDLTGSNRADLAYLLENVVDPNAVIPADYVASVIDTKDGRTIIGIIKKQDAHAVTVQTANELLTLGRDEIDTIKTSKLSMMPEGIMDKFPNEDLRDVIAYLRSPRQVP